VNRPPDCAPAAGSNRLVFGNAIEVNMPSTAVPVGKGRPGPRSAASLLPLLLLVLLMKDTLDVSPAPVARETATPGCDVYRTVLPGVSLSERGIPGRNQLSYRTYRCNQRLQQDSPSFLAKPETATESVCCRATLAALHGDTTVKASSATMLVRHSAARRAILLTLWPKKQQWKRCCSLNWTKQSRRTD
jgi:hypothetical protein